MAFHFDVCFIYGTHILARARRYQNTVYETYTRMTVGSRVMMVMAGRAVLSICLSDEQCNVALMFGIDEVHNNNMLVDNNNIGWSRLVVLSYRFCEYDLSCIPTNG